MNPDIHQTADFIKRQVITFLTIVAVAACLMPAAALAQNDDQQLQVVAQQSTASLFLGSQHDPTSLNAGAARVSGTIGIHPDQIPAFNLNFIIYPSQSNLDGVLTDSTFDVNRFAALNDEPVISFQSSRAVQRSDGKLGAAGKLTLFHPENTLDATPSEAYSGPVLEHAKLVEVSQPAIFVLDDDSDQSSSQSSSTLQLVGSITVNGEAFPELYNSGSHTAWRPVVNNENCQMPASVGEDYSGPTCTGELVKSGVTQVILASTGEDYSGVILAAPSGNQITIQLHLELTNGGPATSANTQSGIQKGN